MAKKNATKKAAATAKKVDTRRWETIEGGGGDRPDWDLKADGPIDGRIRSAKSVTTEFEGVQRPRCLVVVQVEGEDFNVWLPGDYAEPLRRRVGYSIRASKTGEGRDGTRYQVETAR